MHSELVRMQEAGELRTTAERIHRLEESEAAVRSAAEILDGVPIGAKLNGVAHMLRCIIKELEVIAQFEQ